MSILSLALARGRALAESRMTETVTVGEFRDGTDTSTGQPTRVLVTSRYSGPGRVKYPSLTVSPTTSPGQLVTVQQLTLSVPAGSARLQEGDEVDVSASTVDGLLVGRRYRVEGAPQAGQTTAHRYPLKELS